MEQCSVSSRAKDLDSKKESWKEISREIRKDTRKGERRENSSGVWKMEIQTEEMWEIDLDDRSGE